ncbi:hypothetical protein BO83DRAFT_398440 [Aspergillus eucalypticola CBS 122712]|uniref:Uncharacterized protein n=1 Tax=Aspergillus eucalypticola (strain CBS 122712 / IBT 29274) TaxID=1448314 RepID=A0A317VLB4_ASPEC|nr:uncharacterized protein BO83DRAFT_398440 [Aspergillus eucalypticola CBS 122712]PWY74001.1 hypothetical protein BO83DRAFT_398440 [Aspergillus eucalypticola CBS 122712]
MDVWSGMLIDVGCPDWETGWEQARARAMMHSGRQSHVQTLHRLAKEVGGSDQHNMGERRPWTTLEQCNSDQAGNGLGEWENTKSWGERSHLGKGI